MDIYVNPDKSTEIPDTLVETTVVDDVIKTSNNKRERLIDGIGENFNEFLHDIFDGFERKEEQEQDTPINVDEISSRVAKIYESIRKVVDWQDENLVKRNAIERILKRMNLQQSVFMAKDSKQDFERYAKEIIIELIRYGYLPNGGIGYKKIKVIETVLIRYDQLIRIHINKKIDPIKGISLKKFILELEACEIEYNLEEPFIQNSLVNLLVNNLSDSVTVTPEDNLYKDNSELLIYIAAFKSLFHVDDVYMIYMIIVNHLDGNKEYISKENNQIDLFKVLKLYEEIKSNPYLSKLYYYLSRFTAYYLVIADIIENLIDKNKDLMKNLSGEKFIKNINDAYEQKVSKFRDRSKKAAIFSTLSVLFAGLASLIILEIPIARLFSKNWSPMSIIMDLTLPFIIMGLIVFTVRKSKMINISEFVTKVENIIKNDQGNVSYMIEKGEKRSRLFLFVSTLLYILPMYLLLWLCYEIFSSAGVPFTSLYINTINIALVIFAGILIRIKSYDFDLYKKETIGDFYFDIITVPLARVGQWLSIKWKSYNFLNILVIAFLDMPFSRFLNFLTGWRSFIREKKAELST